MSSLLALTENSWVDILNSFSFQPTDIVDVLFVAILIYVGLRIVLETNSLPMIAGILALLTFYGLSLFFDLPLTRLTLQPVLSILLVILAIVFQHELRRLFTFFNLIGWTGKRERPEETLVSLIVKTAEELALRKIGALLVIPGREPIEPFLAGGYPLGGQFSEPLLLSIFDPTSPGHDGAVVIEEGKVSRFGTQLPLADQIEKVRDYGTRHRAALGLAERSDALIIAISEERGQISVARNRQIVVVARPRELAHVLKRFYEEKFPYRNLAYFSNAFLRNTTFILMSMVLAGGLWLIDNRNSPQVQKNFTVPLEFKNVLADHVVEESVPQEVVLSLEGRSGDFNSFSPEKDLRIVLDLGGLESGRHQAVITSSDVKHPINFNLIKIEPEKIRVRVTEKPNLKSEASSLNQR